MVVLGGDLNSRSLSDFSSIGFEHVIFNMPNVHKIVPNEIVGEEITPQIAEAESVEE